MRHKIILCILSILVKINTEKKSTIVRIDQMTGNTALRLDKGQIEVLDDDMAEVLRRKTPAERIKIGSNMWKSARRMLLAHLKSTHPDWTDQAVEQEVARRLSRGDTEINKDIQDRQD